MGAAASCGPTSGPYPAVLPAGVSLPNDVSILQPDDKDAVEKAVSLCAKTFAGTSGFPGPAEFDWLLFNAKHEIVTDTQERVHRMIPVMTWALQQAFVLKDRGICFVVRGKEDAIIGVLVMYLYTSKWKPDSMMLQMKVMRVSGASKWDEPQQDMMYGSRMYAFDKAINGMKKMYCVGDSSRFACVQVLAVEPEFHNKGFGTKLLSAASAVADGLNLPLYLETDAGQNSAFFEKRGFEELGSWPLEVKNGGKFEGRFLAMRKAAKSE